MLKHTQTTQIPTSTIVFHAPDEQQPRCRSIAVPREHFLHAWNLAYGEGFRCGERLCLQQDPDHWHLPNDTQFTDLIVCYLPRKLAPESTDDWRRGFLFGWVLAFYHGPLHHDGFCDEDEPMLQRVQLLGSWTDVHQQAIIYIKQFADCQAVEVVDWGSTSRAGRSYIALEWAGDWTSDFEAFFAALSDDPTVEEIFRSEVEAPVCANCLPRATMVLPHVPTKMGGAQ